jgi:phosphate transport system substrate-binding protein
MNRRSLLLASGALALAPRFAGAQGAQITGAGATFPAPVYAKWGEAAKAGAGIQLNYQAIGSGGGQNQIFNRTVDFGASDAPVAADKLAEQQLLQFPSVMGAVVVIVNLPGVEDDQLKLTGELIADIYAGKITKWNDPRLVEANAGLTLPNIAIAPAYRADASGTSFVFTSYLSAVSPEWKAGPGAGTSVKWPTGSGARGNDGVAGTVRNVRGGIGYVESAFASHNKLLTTQIRNKAGHYVKPTIPAFQAAAANADWSAANFAANLIDTHGDASWPIVTPTFILLPKAPKDDERALNVIKFFDWAFTHGDAMAAELEYVPLPASVKALIRAALKAEIKGANGQPIWR